MARKILFSFLVISVIISSSTSSPFISSSSLPECPAEADPSIITFLPDPDNCGAFYECVYGNAYHYNCYPGLYYNENAHVCDYEVNVVCGTRPHTTTSSTTNCTTSAPTSSTTNSTTSAPTSATTNATTTTDITPPTKECPPEADPTIVTFLPDEDNCGAFYECIYGHAYHYYCYPGLYYNEDTHVCDYQANVRCGSRLTTSTTTTTTTVAPPFKDN